MLDVITGGRLITGFVRGVGSEYFSFGTNRSIRSSATRRRTIWWCGPGPSPGRSRSRASTTISNT